MAIRIVGVDLPQNKRGDIIFIGKLFHRDHLIKIVFMARSHYTVLTLKNRIYNYTAFNSAVHQNKLHPIKEPL